MLSCVTEEKRGKSGKGDEHLTRETEIGIRQFLSDEF